MIGHRWSPDAFQIRDFLARHQVPYHWMDVESDTEAKKIRGTRRGSATLPLVLLTDGTRLANPRGRAGREDRPPDQAEKPFTTW